MKFPEDRSEEFRRDTQRYAKSWARNLVWLGIFAFGSISLATAQQPSQSGAAPASAVQAPAVQAPAVQAPATAEASDASKPATPQTPQQKQLAEDTAKLQVLADELKAELDKSSKDTLSLGVIKKAEQVEKLAHKVLDEMKSKSPDLQKY